MEAFGLRRLWWRCLLMPLIVSHNHTMQRFINTDLVVFGRIGLILVDIEREQ